METLAVSLTKLMFVANENSLDILDYTTIAKDIATIFTLLVGLYLGNKGIKKYLLRDIIKTRVQSIQSANTQAKEITSKILRELNDANEDTRIANSADLEKIFNHTTELVEVTSDSSHEIHTLAFLLHETMKNIEPKVVKEFESSKRIENKTNQEFNSLLFNICKKINFYANNIVDIPKSTKVVNYSEIRKEIRPYLSNKGFSTVKDLRTGLNLDANSAITNIFFSTLNKSVSSYVFAKNFFQVLRDNTPVAYNLYLNRIYFPITLYKPDSHGISKAFGADKLHLIKVKKMETVIGEKSNYYKLTYSNIQPSVKFVDSITLDHLKTSFRDDFLPNNKSHFTTIVKKFSKLAEESIELECEEEDLKAYFKLIEKDFKKKLKSLK